MRYTATIAATLVAGAAAAGHKHNHAHFHAKKAASKVEKRGADVVVEYVAGPTATVYEVNGELVDAEEAQEGLDSGEYVVVGESVPTFSPPPPPKPTTTSSELDMGAQFIEIATTTSTPEPEPTTSTSAAPSSSKAPEPKPEPKPEKSNDGAKGIDAKFPNGEIECSTFPSDYGAVPIEWMNMNGWSGIQYTPGFELRVSTSISEIHTGIDGSECKSGAMCSYACPPGYQKAQFPTAQGSTKQSIGGLWCNDDGFLERTSEDHETLCIKGVGGVTIQNDLDEVVATCRTDYPGTENMVIPATAYGGETVDLCNPDQDSYYIWDGKSTSAQYYVNKAGYAEEDACRWDCLFDHDGCGNWAPVIAGVGRASDGITYLSIFQNLPMSTAKLNFNIEITGDVTSECSYIDGKWSGGGSGCTTGMNPGGKAVFRYF